MADIRQMNVDDMKVDTASLYREETLTDLKVATIRRMIPVKPDGGDDTSRPTLYVAETHVVTPMGALPINARIAARNLQEACDRFPEAIREAVDKLVHEIEEHRRESSRIITPGQMGGPGPITLK